MPSCQLRYTSSGRQPFSISAFDHDPCHFSQGPKIEMSVLSSEPLLPFPPPPPPTSRRGIICRQNTTRACEQGRASVGLWVLLGSPESKGAFWGAMPCEGPKVQCTKIAPKSPCVQSVSNMLNKVKERQLPRKGMSVATSAAITDFH